MSYPKALSEDAMITMIAVLARSYATKIAEPDVAADLAQEVTIACLKKLRAGRLPASPSSLCSLVRRMIRHRAIDWVRSSRRRAVRDGQHYREWCMSMHEQMSPETAIEDSELSSFYTETLASLPEICRLVYIMIRDEGVPYADVAKQLGISRSTVRWHLVAAQQRFRSALEERRTRAIGPYR